MNPFVRGISLLNDSGIRYVLGGGFAGVLHGNNRFTSDLDVIIDFSEQPVSKLLATLSSSGMVHRNTDIDPSKLSDSASRASWVKDKKLRFISFYHPANPTFVIDFFIEHYLPFESLMKNAKEVTIEGRKTRIVSIDDLIEMKRMAGRPQDQLDIEALEMLKKKASNGSGKV